MAGQPSALELVDLTKRFGHVTAVDGVALTIPAGSFFALLGPSGCGKTTTLRMVAGLEDPTSGRILLGADDITHRKPYRRPVNTVFQSYALFPHLDIFENVAFGLRRRRVADVRAQVERMLALVELAGYGSRRTTQLSGGQQQRVALARALINHPQVLLLDEPLGALDLKLRRQMQVELKRIQTEVGITFVHVTHDQEEAMTMADRVAVMKDGRVEQLGDPVELYERPATAFVASFLGQSNLLDGTVAGRDGEAVVVSVGGHRLAVRPAGAWSLGSRVQVGVRPEKIRLAASGRPPGQVGNELEGVVTDSSFTGLGRQYLVATSSGQELTVFTQNLDVDEQFAPGDAVSLRWSPDHTFAVAPGEAPPLDEEAAAFGVPATPTPGTVADTFSGAETADR
jgi:spermidine/putrescine transport system ATP-binding protein